LNTDEIERTAIHEAGHAACIALCGLPLWRVEIFPTGKEIAGRCLLTRWRWTKLPPYNWRQDALVCCAGYAAEVLCLGTGDRETADRDFENVSRILTKHGKGLALETLIIETTALLTRYRSAIRAIADELLASRRLTGQRVKEIVGSNKRIFRKGDKCSQSI
jgi:ATP-dependent Zn protease